MYIKRIILATNSRLLTDIFHRVIDRARNLEVVCEVGNAEQLPLAIQRFCPEWVIIAFPLSDSLLTWIRAFMQDNSPVRFIFFSPDQHIITLKWQLNSAEDISNLSLREFTYLLEKDRQPFERQRRRAGS